MAKLDNVDPEVVEIEEFAPFIGYVCVYFDKDERHCDILSHVEKMTGPLNAEMKRPSAEVTEYYMFFQGRKEPVAVVRTYLFTLESFR